MSSDMEGRMQDQIEGAQQQQSLPLPQTKGCPFCGCETVYAELVSNWLLAAVCSHCLARGPVVTTQYANIMLIEGEADRVVIRAWNDRCASLQNEEVAADVDRVLIANAYYDNVKNLPTYTRKRVTLAMLRDILRFMVYPAVLGDEL